MSAAPLRILLVEDNRADIKGLSTVLAEDGYTAYELVVAECLAHGLERAGEGGIDVVLLDLTVPGSAGAQTVAAFNRIAPHIPILVVTEVESDKVSLETVQAGAQDCLLKSRLAGHWLWRAIRYSVERQVLEEQLRRSQKMQAIGQLAGGVAHDFNNLLQIINGRAQLALEKLQPGEPLHRELSIISQTGQRAAVLTQQLLAFSRRQILRPEVLVVNEVVAGLEPMLRGALPETLSLVLILDEALKPVRADRGQLEQVLLNLAVNARDAMPDGGTLTIQTSNVISGGLRASGSGLLRNYSAHDSGLFNIKIKDQKPHVLLTVRDTGCGMDAATVARAFEPFFTTKEQGKGTGLGLATVYGIVRQSGGHIRVDSGPGKGTSVKIYLPQVEGTPIPDHSSKTLPAVTHGGETILLVEDEAAVRDLICEMLRTQSYTVLPCADGRQALEVCQSHPGKIDLLMTDVVMPGMSGPVLAAAVQGVRPNMLELFISGYMGDSAAEQNLMERGAQFIQKPFTTKNLSRKIREVLDGNK